MRKTSFHLALVAAVLHSVQSQAALSDTNFQESIYATVGSGVTGMAWAPDNTGRLFVTRKAGEVVIVKDGAVLPTPFATVSPVYTFGECGLMGLCFDPNFTVNGYVYLFVTVTTSQQQIIRYTAAGDIGMDKTVIVSNLPTGGNLHNGGGIGIGPDGRLYWAVGDNGSSVGVDTNLISLGSKVGRANLDGSLPADNPFADGPGGANDYIWARGFRNPYTLTFQPETGALWVNCVGTSYEQLFLVNAGDHAGYRLYENNQPNGFMPPRIKYRTNNTDTRSIAPGGAARAGNIATFTTTVAHGFRQGEKLVIKNVIDASFNGTFYVASTPDATTFTVEQTGPDASSGGGSAQTQNQGGCVTGGTFFNSTAVPVEYRQNFFYGDYNSWRILRATFDETNGVRTADYFASGSNQQIDLDVGPDGALYGVNYSGTVRRYLCTNIPSQQLVITPAIIRMTEGGRFIVNVRLALPISTNVVVNIAHASGDPDISIASSNSITFTPTTWSNSVAVELSAAVDPDAIQDTASIELSCAAAPMEAIAVFANDIRHDFHLDLTSVAPASITLQGLPGQRYVLEANNDLQSAWIPFSTNILQAPSSNILDSSSALHEKRFYRGRLWP